MSRKAKPWKSKGKKNSRGETAEPAFVDGRGPSKKKKRGDLINDHKKSRDRKREGDLAPDGLSATKGAYYIGSCGRCSRKSSEKRERVFLESIREKKNKKADETTSADTYFLRAIRIGLEETIRKGCATVGPIEGVITF